MLFPSRTTLFVFVSTLLFCATAVERIQSLLRMTCVVCGKYTNNCANLKYESISKGLFFLFHLFSRPKLDFFQEWDRFHLPSTTPLLRIHEKRLLRVTHSPCHRVVWKIHCLISNLVVFSYELDSSQNTLIEKDRGITIFNETTFDYYIECDTELEPNRYYSLRYCSSFSFSIFL